MSRPVTIRVQKVKKNRIRARLFFFLFLAVVLVLVSFFADQIVPYDPYGQNLSLSRQPPSAASEPWQERCAATLGAGLILF